MTTEEFLEIMADNASDFPEFALLPHSEKEKVANLNILTGPTKAFRNAEGRLEGVGGVRIAGVGEAWMITPRTIQSHPDHSLRRQQFQKLIKDTQEAMKIMFDENDLWRVFAIGKLSMTYVEHLGFKRIGNGLLWERT